MRWSEQSDMEHNPKYMGIAAMRPAQNLPLIYAGSTLDQRLPVYAVNRQTGEK